VTQETCLPASAAQPTARARSIFSELVVLLLSWVGSVMLIAPGLSLSPVRFVYNPSDSAPRGLYMVEPASRLHPGDLVVVRLGHDVAALAAQRQYLPPGVPVIKPVAAIAPQHVCANAAGIHIDGEWVAPTMSVDASGRMLTAWTGCRRLVDTEIFLLGAHAASFDSRYFGPVDAIQVLGRARPLGGRRGHD
jgi:conjugative transfer signal peptidase TraF